MAAASRKATRIGQDQRCIMTLDSTLLIGLRRDQLIDVLLALAFFAGFGLTAVAGYVVASDGVTTGGGLIAAVVVMNSVALLRFVWKPENRTLLLAGKLACQLVCIGSVSLAALGVAVFASSRSIAVSPGSITTAVTLFGLWAVGNAILAQRDWQTILKKCE